MKRVALYVRVSTQEQKNYGISVDSQIDALRKYCKENNFYEVGLYNDAGISARKKYTKRPDLLRLLEDCKSGKIDLILFTKLDRWFRNIASYYEVQQILDDNHVSWQSIWEDYETETSSGQLKVNIMLSVAQSEADRTSERIKAVNVFRRDKGQWISGSPPYGYIIKDKKLCKDEKTRDGLEVFFRAYMDYRPMDECILMAREHGYTPSKTHSYHMLKNEHYVYSSDPYLTDDDFKKIRKRATENTIRRPDLGSTKFIFQGICVCGYCGKNMANEIRHRHSPNLGDYDQKYIHCHSRNYTTDKGICPTPPTINESVLERILLERLNDDVIRYNLTISGIETDETDNSIQKKIDALNGRINRLQTMFEMGDISLDEYKAKRDAVKKEISSIDIPKQKELIILPDDWVDTYKQLSIENKSIFWHRIVRKIVIYRYREIEILF